MSSFFKLENWGSEEFICCHRHTILLNGSTSTSGCLDPRFIWLLKKNSEKCMVILFLEIEPYMNRNCHMPANLISWYFSLHANIMVSSLFLTFQCWTLIFFKSYFKLNLAVQIIHVCPVFVISALISFVAFILLQLIRMLMVSYLVT